jgi:hypothetical protein
MATVKGLGVVFGISSAVTTIAGSAVSYKLTGQSVAKEAETVIVKDKDGETKGMVIYDPRDVVGLTVYPHGASLADAKTANALPDIGDAAVLTDADDADLGGTTYVVTSSSKSKSNTDVTSFDVEVTKYSTDISTTISS